MNIKRIAIVGCAVALVGAMTATAFAGTATSGNGMFANKGQQAALTATQVEENAADREVLKAERTENREARMADKDATKEACVADRELNRETRQAEMTAMSEAWDALTDVEKESVYQLQEDKINAQIAIIDGYLALGLIDADRASEMKTNLTERIADLRTDGEFPMMGGFGHNGVEGRNFDRDLCTDEDEVVEDEVVAE